MNRPKESDYTSQVAYTRALEKYCDELQEQEPVALDVTLDEAAVEMLNAFSSPSPDLDDYSELRLMLGEGHSGYGLYLSLAEYPEEGSELLVNTHPPKREFVGLTDDEMLMIYGQQHEGKKYNLGRMVEAKLKEKNT